jgi:phosphoglucosamine mutase
VGRLFGTDGIRGVAGVDVTAELAERIAFAAVSVLAEGEARPLVVVGRDPRPSGGELAAALIDTLTVAAGADVIDLGVIPTPAVAHALAGWLPALDREPAFAVVVSASHNPVDDNGIKLFGRGGRKLSTPVEDEIERRLGRPRPLVRYERDVRRVTDHAWYADRLLAATEGFGRLDGLRIVVDCANGVVARDVYAGAGADVVVINDDLSGERINEGCGATHLAALQAAVAEHRADAGIAHDGDADRCLAVDAAGRVVDGDAILAILAVALHRAGRLRGDAIAVTVMSNQGLVTGLAAHGIDIRRTDVGDRAVLERMLADGLALGGEQSGHIVLLDQATTGDGLLTALALLGSVVRSGRPLADLAAVVTPLPQVLVNVRVGDKDAALAAAGEASAAVSAELGRDGRVLVRPSGTEPLLRVMVEAPTEQMARAAADRIAAAAVA